jgi:RNA polymerase sigma factor (sigma-70 family)
MAGDGTGGGVIAMDNGRTGRAIRSLHSAALARATGLTDGELLEAFVAGRDEAAFEALVRRHGPMVFGLCRRILGGCHDAEDAFQATFLVLVRKAASVMPRELVANWLYGVAYRTASKARVMNAKRRAKEGRVRELSATDAHHEFLWNDLMPLLDRELQALPDKYRAPVVLCDLEGKPRKEAAQQLGWPEGTVSSRLAAGRKLLALRLGRRGVSLSVAALVVALARAAQAAVPSSLLAATVRTGLLTAAGKAGAVPASVTRLADGVAKTLLLSKLKVATVVLLAMSLGGAGLSLRAGLNRVSELSASAPSSAVAKIGNRRFAFVTPAQDVPPPEVAHQPNAPPPARVGQVWVFQGRQLIIALREGDLAEPQPCVAQVPPPAVAFLVTGQTHAGWPRNVGEGAVHGLQFRARGAAGVQLKCGCEFILDLDESWGAHTPLAMEPPSAPPASTPRAGPCGREPVAAGGFGSWTVVVVPGRAEAARDEGESISIAGGKIRITIRPGPRKGTVTISSKCSMS